MKSTNYDLQGKIQKLNSNIISTKTFNGIEPQKANQTLLQASLDPSLMIQC
jgi:cell division protein FtsL